MKFSKKRRQAAAICRRVLKIEGKPKPPEGRGPINKQLLNTAQEVIDSCYSNGDLVDAVISADKEDLTKYSNQELLYQYCFVLNNRVKRIKAAMKDVLKRDGEEVPETVKERNG